ncbi:MAG: hypothetical protein IPG01_13245 [Chitinophagaceae bacterium]|nr:hypothetical protein [Chitinophagaceae bacterium]
MRLLTANHINDNMESKEGHNKKIENEEVESVQGESSILPSTLLESCNKTEDELLRELAKILVEAYLGERPYGEEKGSDILPSVDKRTS